MLLAEWHYCKPSFSGQKLPNLYRKAPEASGAAEAAGRVGCVLCVRVCVCAHAAGLTPAPSKCLLNDSVPEGTCTASWDRLNETSNWLDIEVRRWDTKVVPCPAFLIQLGPDKIAAGKTTNQIRWQFSTVSNCCCGKGGPDKINQLLKQFSHSWIFLFLPPYPFLLSENTACLVNANTGNTHGVPYHSQNKMQRLIYWLDYWETIILCSLWCFAGRCSTLQSEQWDCNEVFTKGAREGGWWWVRQLL